MIVEKHQVSGLDERERGFSRLAEIDKDSEAYRAVLRYEATVVVTDGQHGATEAIRALVETLHAMGYRQVRTRLNFRGAEYFGSREFWVEHPDPDGGPPADPAVTEQLARRTGWIGRALKLFGAK